MDECINKILVRLDDMRMLADITIREIASPDNLDVYSNLCYMIDSVKEMVEELNGGKHV